MPILQESLCASGGEKWQVEWLHKHFQEGINKVGNMMYVLIVRDLNEGWEEVKFPDL